MAGSKNTGVGSAAGRSIGAAQEISQGLPEETGSAFLSRLREEGINTEEGMRFMGNSEEQYIEIMQLFVTDSPEKKDRLERFYEEEDWKEYGILVHAVKSNMRSIGADELADMAFELEKAAKAENAAFVKEHHQEFVLEWMILLAGLKYIPTLGIISDLVKEMEAKENEEAAAEEADGQSADACSEEEFAQAAEEIAALLDDFDTDEAKEKLDALMQRVLTAEQKKIAADAAKATHAYDYDAAIEILRA